MFYTSYIKFYVRFGLKQSSLKLKLDFVLNSRLHRLEINTTSRWDMALCTVLRQRFSLFVIFAVLFNLNMFDDTPK